jgi:glycerophosphoryl diester phosphodiesterase
MTRSTGPVAALAAAQLAGLDARGSCPTWPDRVGMPTLAEVLGRFGVRTRFAIEIKRDVPDRLARVAEATVAAIQAHQLGGRVLVSSFEPEALVHVRRLAPDVPRAYIGAFDAPHFLETALELGCAQIDVPIATGSADVVRAAQAHGLRVCGWLGNTPEAIRTLVAWGVDAITTDYPTIARRELGS